MYELLIAQIARRAGNRSTRIDVSDMGVPEIAAPLANSDAEASEATLGFPVPPLLKNLYHKVGNGGFGPGYGLLGPIGGARDDLGRNSVQVYRLNSLPDPEDVDWNWPDGLLPICHWGCAIYSCIDCRSEGFPMAVFDPNLHESSWAQCFLPQKRHFDSWLAAWAAGRNIWNEMVGDQEGA